MGSSARLVVMGVREPGASDFRITVYGNSGRQLPPAVLIASLTEFREWILQTQSGRSDAGTSPVASGPA
jgi:hypothetical protein